MSCNALFPPPLMITGSSPAASRYSTTSLDVWVEFSQGVPHAKTEAGISFKENGTVLAGRFFWQGNRVSFVPDKGFSLGNRYDLTVAANVEDDQGVDLGSEFNLTFYTRPDDSHSGVAISTPANGASTNDPFQPITVTFTKAPNRSSFYSSLTFSPSFKAAYVWGAGDLSCVITPTEALKNQTVYTVKVGSGMLDAQGVSVGTETSLWFTEGTAAPAPVVTQVVNTVLNPATGVYSPGGVVLSAVGSPSGTVTYGDQWESTWGIEVDFDRPILRAGLESFLSVDPAWGFSIPYTQAAVSQIVLVPTAKLTYGTIYTLTLKKGIVDQQGNPTLVDQIYRFKVDGPLSAPPAVSSIVFQTNIPAAPTYLIPGNHSQDFTKLPLDNFSTTASATSVDLSFTLASGASIDLASVMGHFSMTATDPNTVASVTAVSLSSPTQVHVSLLLAKGVGMGLIYFKLSAGLADTLGNVTAVDQTWPVLQ